MEIEDYRDVDGSNDEIATAAARQLDDALRAAVDAAQVAERTVMNATMDDCLTRAESVLRDPYECWVESREASEIARAQGAIGVALARSSALVEVLGSGQKA